MNLKKRTLVILVLLISFIQNNIHTPSTFRTVVSLWTRVSVVAVGVVVPRGALVPLFRAGVVHERGVGAWLGHGAAQQ